MSQHDYIIADAAGSAFLADLNLAFPAIAENNSGTSAPSVTYAHMWWADTTNDILKQRNAANTGWLNRYTLSTGAMLGQGLGTPASGVLTNCTGSPTLTAPALGTPASGVLTNCTGIPGAQVTGTVPSATAATTATNGGTSGTFTITGTGFTANPTATATWHLNNNVVTLNIPINTMQGTSNATSFTLTGLTTAINPANPKRAGLLSAIDNTSTYVACDAYISANVITLLPARAGQAWTASGTKALYDGTITWTID